MSRVRASIIVAADVAGGIGHAGGMPWHLPGDLRRFKQLTVGDGRNAVIMGRKTWDALPASVQPLPGRRNVVLTRGPAPAPGIVRAGSLDEALFACADLDHAWIIGGGQVYAEALRHPAVEVVELTRVWSTFPCDTFFGPLPDDFALDALSEPRSDADVTYVYERYARR